MNLFFKSIFIFILIAILSACGFQLRTPQIFSPQLDAVYINASTPNDPFTQTLIRTLVANNVNVVSKPKQATATLNILNIQSGSTMMAGGGMNISGAYVASLTVNFSVIAADGKVLIPPRALQQSQNFMSNATQVLSGASTVNQLTSQMDQSLADQVMLQLSKIRMTSGS
ncbi:MAG: LPS assembly lipoprotein LptE [Gammaproteobacteria bacterium]|jgi:LPS-assembly lipoprotein|nr:LPS assembly lipoprotein LptE [Gammaproteobacteria bacterium]